MIYFKICGLKKVVFKKENNNEKVSYILYCNRFNSNDTDLIGCSTAQFRVSSDVMNCCFPNVSPADLIDKNVMFCLEQYSYNGKNYVNVTDIFEMERRS